MAVGKNCRKKLRQRLNKQVEQRLDEEGYFSAVGSPRTKETDLAYFQAFTDRIKAEVSAQHLKNWATDLKACASKLGRPGCWAFLEEHRNLADALGILPDLQFLTVQAAEKFAGNSVRTLATPMS